MDPDGGWYPQETTVSTTWCNAWYAVDHQYTVYALVYGVATHHHLHEHVSPRGPTSGISPNSTIHGSPDGPPDVGGDLLRGGPCGIHILVRYALRSVWCTTML